jgi:undecaprenyl diphosphate synthase
MHVAFIPDGNRRWAKKNNVNLRDAYKKGIEHFSKVLQWSKELGVNEVSIWAISYDNYFNRPKEEIDILFSLFEEYYQTYKDKTEEIIKKYPEIENTRIYIGGYIEVLEEKYRKYAEEINNRIVKDEKYRVNFLVIYNGRIEIIKALEKMKNGFSLEDSLMLNRYPDIIIRTGGRVRTSGFLPIQSEYSEWYFLEKLWPEFDKEDYIKVLEDFQTRQRNFGK